MIEKYLPIGTVVMLHNATKRLMITGFCAMTDENKNKMFDYTGILYPEGVLNSEQTILFDHDQIDKVFFIGFVDEEEKGFKALLKEFVEKNDNKSYLESIQEQIEELDMPKAVEVFKLDDEDKYS